MKSYIILSIFQKTSTMCHNITHFFEPHFSKNEQMRPIQI